METQEINLKGLTWQQARDLYPAKPYEQSEKYGHYNQRIIDHYNDLYYKWLQQNQQTPQP